MVQIEINGNKIQHNLANNKNMYELLPIIKKTYLNENEQIMEIFINETKVLPKNKENLYGLPLDEVQVVSLSTSRDKSLILETIDSLPRYIDNLVEKTMLAVSFYNKEQIDLGHSVFEDIIENLDVYIQLISQIHQTLTIESDIKLDSQSTVKQLEIHLLSVLKALMQAQQKNDLIMLTDLLEYELRDNLTQWKISAIPHIKKLNTN
jgi:uncharacterized pyridoxamine 5'-phosphate oxidase family protein